jgi:hypothetical protein
MQQPWIEINSTKFFVTAELSDRTFEPIEILLING